jgi:hypothetical protein
MRAFLSHSSKDKGFVKAVADLLKPGSYELDSETFDAGLVNSQAITAALKRCDLFCLFLSRQSVNSSYVNFETLLGIEFFARGLVNQFLAICLDDDSFSIASDNVRYFNVVRKAQTEESTARLIQGALITAADRADKSAHPFIGREAALIELENQATDIGRPNSKAIYVSGNAGSGRRTVIRKFYQNQYPSVGPVFPQITIAAFSGLEELFRNVLQALRPAMRVAELRTRLSSFEMADQKDRAQQIADLLSSVLATDEAVMLVDDGGLLADSGAFQPEITMVIDRLADKPHPPVAFVAPRMPMRRFQRSERDVAYVALQSLSREDSGRLASRLLRSINVKPTPSQLAEILNLAGGHPYNFYRLSGEIKDIGIEAFLANPSTFIEWKHRQSSEYVRKIDLSSTETDILAILGIVPVLDFEAIVSSLHLDAEDTADALSRLVGLHIIEHNANAFIIAPAVRVAIERDARIRLEKRRRLDALRAVSASLSVRIEEGAAPINLIDAAILASVESGNSSSVASAFLLPSHYVWLAKRNYDQRDYPETIRLAQEALRGQNRLSVAGVVAACRFMCLAASRRSENGIFEDGIRKLEQLASDNWAKSNVAFLRGFNERMKGRLPAAEEYFVESYHLSPGNISSAREISAISLARNKLEEAEKYAREAKEYSARNPYVLDILLTVLIRKLGKKAASNAEVIELFDILRVVGEEDGRSFFSTRKAELEHLWGDNRLALNLIEEAIQRTNTIFEPRRLHAEILLKDGNLSKAKDVISWMRERVNSQDPAERRTNYRQYLETYSHYLTESGQYNDAKEIYNDSTVFTEKERNEGIRQVEIVQAFKTRH